MVTKQDEEEESKMESMDDEKKSQDVAEEEAAPKEEAETKEPAVAPATTTNKKSNAATSTDSDTTKPKRGAPATEPGAVSVKPSADAASLKERTSAPATTPGALAMEPGAVNTATTAAAAALTEKARTAPPARLPGAVAVEPGTPQTTTRAAAEHAKTMTDGAVEPSATVTTTSGHASEKPHRNTAPATTPGAVVETGRVKQAVQHYQARAPSSPGAKKATVQESVDAERNIRSKIQVHQTSSHPKVGSVDKSEEIPGVQAKDKDAELKTNDTKSSEMMFDKEMDLEKGDKMDEPSTTEVNRGMIQGPTFEHHTVQKAKDDEKELPKAEPVNEQEEMVAAAVVYERDSRPFFKRPAFWLFVIALLVIAGIVVVVTVALTGDDSDDIPGSEETVSPTPVPTSVEFVDFKVKVTEMVGRELIESSPLAFKSTVEWFWDDPLKYTNVTLGVDETSGERRIMEITEETLSMQRFALAWLWYHTTENGEDPWLSCNPPNASEGEDESCRLLTVSVVELIDDEVVMCYAGVPSTRWLSATNECDWPGVNCEDTNTIAYEVDLLAVGLKGTFPSFLQIMPGIESIQLTYGALKDNFPDDMNGFNSMRQLVVIGNLLEDPIPDSFFNMPLWVLNLAYNKFKGALPDSIGKFDEIGGLYLMDNEFEGPLPDSLANAVSLVFLRLENNALADTSLPSSWGNLTDLQLLFMYNNDLTGTIPQEWSGMTSMTNFRLYDNDLEGPLPNMTEWENLERIFMQGNRFNGTFPDEFYNNRVLQYIQFGENEFSGPLEDRFNETGLNNLIAIALNDNQFTGTIPPSLEGLDAIRIIRLYYNQFDGEVPDNLCNIRGTSTLTLLETDCAGDPIANECSCCTSCCDRDAKICELVEERRLSVDDVEEEEEEIIHPHQRKLPRKRRKLQANDCTAQYRWDRETGRLIEYVEDEE